MSQYPPGTGPHVPKRPIDNILTLIREDMDVYDVNGDHIGEVEFVHLGSATPTEAEFGVGPATADDIDMREPTILDIVARAFDDEDMPDVLRRRLLYNGFIKVDGDGLFASDRYVMPDQIAAVSDDRVQLRVSRKELVKE